MTTKNYANRVQKLKQLFSFRFFRMSTIITISVKKKRFYRTFRNNFTDFSVNCLISLEIFRVQINFRNFFYRIL